MVRRGRIFPLPQSGSLFTSCALAAVLANRGARPPNADPPPKFIQKGWPELQITIRIWRHMHSDVAIVCAQAKKAGKRATGRAPHSCAEAGAARPGTAANRRTSTIATSLCENNILS